MIWQDVLKDALKGKQSIILEYNILKMSVSGFCSLMAGLYIV